MATTVRDRRPSRDERPQPGSGKASSLRHDEKRAPQPVKSSHIITEYIDVAVPAQTAFELWTRYDKWSEIFKKESAERPSSRASASHSRNGNRVRGSGKTEVKVRAKIGPSERQWTAQVVGTEPGRRVDWKSKGPLKAFGTTTFHRLDDRLTKVMVEIEYQPTGFIEIVGNFFRMQRRRVRRDLRLFKNYAELRGVGEKDEAGDRGEDEGRS